MDVKVTFTAPAANGINGKTEYKDWKYFLGISEDSLTNKINFALTQFVMKTGVNRDMVKITEEVSYD